MARRALAAAWALALAAVAAGCAHPPATTAPARTPHSYVVLLPDADGHTGAVTVRNAQESVLLDRPMQAVEIDGASIRPARISTQRIEQDFTAAQAVRPAPAEVFRLYFATGEASLTPASERLIADILEATRRRPAADVSVIGHTDTEGDARSNERLGLERARWVAALLNRRGLRAQEITVATHGERDPLVRTPDETREARNRRVEVIVR